MASLNKRFPHYSRLLHLYPKAYAQEYGAQMLQVLADMLDDPERSKVTVWVRTILDLPFSIVQQQLTYAGELANASPRYLKQNARLGAWLVTPFFLYLLTNGLFHQALYHYVQQRQAVLIGGFIVLPALAIMCNLAAVIRWYRQQRASTRLSGQIATVRAAWQALAIILVGFGIIGLVFLHDSSHCLLNNPVRVIHNPHQTLYCIAHS